MTEEMNVDDNQEVTTEPLPSNNSPHNELWALNEMLCKDLEIKDTELENMLHLQSMSILMTEESLLTTKYLELEEKHETIRKERELLQNEIQTLNIYWTQTKQEYDRSIQEKQLFQEELYEIKKQHEKTERELKNKIEALKITIATKQDEIDITCKQKIQSLEISLRESNNSRLNLQAELYRLKVQNNQNYDSLQKKLNYTEQLLREEQNKSNASSMTTVPYNNEKPCNSINSNNNYDDYGLNDFDDVNFENFNNNYSSFQNRSNFNKNQTKIDVPANKTYTKTNIHQDSRQVTNSKYQPLEVTNKFNTNTSFEEIVPEAATDSENFYKRTATVFKGSRKNVGLASPKVANNQNRNNLLPPLKKLSDSKTVKKRKLYDPNNLDYLTELEQQ